MSELLNRLNSEEITGVIAIVCGCTVGAIAIIGGFWYAWRKADMEAALKLELIKQGRSIEEIERVLKATGSTDADHEFKQKVVKLALREGKSADEINRLLKSI